MKLATKIFLSAITVLVLSFNIGSGFFIQTSFDNSLNLYTQSIISEYRTQRYLFETEIATYISQGYEINEDTILKITKKFSEYNFWIDSFVSIGINDKTIFLTNPEVDISNFQTATDISHYNIVEFDDSKVLNITSNIWVDNIKLSFAFGKDVTSLFLQRDNQIFSIFLISLVIVITSGIVLFLIATVLTKNIRILRTATSEISKGNYDNYINIKGNDEISQLADSFNIMAKKVKEAITVLDDYAKSRDVFVTNFSHELKTPMTSIIGFADILRRNSEDEKVLEVSTYIYTECKRLETLSQKMLLLMELEQKQIEFKKENLLNILNSSSSCVYTKKCKINIHCNEKIKVLCDKNLIQTLIINVISNAINASHKNSEINIFASVQQNSVKISIEDYGIGINKDELSKITQPFYMIDKSRKGNSTGVGLSLCEQISSLHNTKLFFESEVNKGTKVSFRLELGDSL